MHFFNIANHSSAKTNRNSVSGKLSPTSSLYAGKLDSNQLLWLSLESNTQKFLERPYQTNSLNNYNGVRHAKLDDIHKEVNAFIQTNWGGPYLTRWEDITQYYPIPMASQILRKLPESTYVPSLVSWYLDTISGIKH